MPMPAQITFGDPMLTMRTIGQHDQGIREDGQPIGRIRGRPRAHSGRLAVACAGQHSRRSRSAALPALTRSSRTSRRMAGVQDRARARRAGGGLSGGKLAQRTMTLRAANYSPR